MDYAVFGPLINHCITDVNKTYFKSFIVTNAWYSLVDE